MSQRKGGGHSRGQTMPYSVVRIWGGKAPTRTPAWTIGAAEEGMLDSLRAANARALDLEIRIIDRLTGETVVEPLRCVVCKINWATETGLARGADAPSVCGDCEEEAPVALEVDTEPLVTALQKKGLHPVVRPDCTVAVEANGIRWVMESQPHEVTGKSCGVWSVKGPRGVRGHFVVRSAVDFIVKRTTP